MPFDTVIFAALLIFWLFLAGAIIDAVAQRRLSVLAIALIGAATAISLAFRRTSLGASLDADFHALVLWSAAAACSVLLLYGAIVGFVQPKRKGGE
jgi:hypothetical protein